VSSEKLPSWLLWQRLSGLEVFQDFTENQRDSFLRAYESDPAIRLRRFGAGEVVCRKGEYELDLCFVLSGNVDLFDYLSGERQKLTTLEAGRFYGELGAIGGLPRTVDVVAGEEKTEIFYVPRHALKFVEINSRARALLADRYRRMAVQVTAAGLELFRGVPPEFIAELVPKCEILRYELRGVPLVTQGEPGDSLYIVRDGFVQVVREREDGTHRVLHYLRSGEYFGEMALFETGVRWASVLTAGKC